MKTILLIMMIASTFQANAQKELRVSYMSFGQWNNRTDEWDWGDDEPSEITITIRSNLITIDNKKGSSFIIDDKLPNKYSEDYSEFECKAVDEKSRDCRIRYIKYRKGGVSQFYIYYHTYAIVYQIDNN